MTQRDEVGAPGSAWALAIAATLGMSVSYIDRQTLAAIAPSVTKALGIDNAHYGLLLSAFSLAYLVGAPAAGIVVDRIGARRGFAAAVLVWSIIAGLHAFAVSFGTLFVLRLLLGAAEAPSFPSAVQSIRRALPGARRPLAFGILFTGSSFGAIVAAKLAVGLDAAYGFRAAFVVTAAIGMLWLPLWFVVSKGFGLERGATHEARSSTPRAPLHHVLTSPPVLRAIVAIVGSAPAMMFVLNWTSKYLVDGWHVPKESIGNYLIAAPLLFDIGAIGFGAIAGRTKTHTNLFAIAMLLQASLALAPLAPSPAVAIALFAASACGGGGVYVLVTNDMLARVPIERTSVAGGMTAAAQSLAHVVFGPLVGWSIDRTHGYGVALVALGLAVPPTMLAFLSWPKIDPKIGDPA
ncbi:MAG: MFS transporter [Labilithrix sp.]|nr:MFS transporter [Labilithrix sp.]MCW5816551.1 MFS transporter [Labilithrix sp.]